MLKKALETRIISRFEASFIGNEILNGQWTDAQIGSFLTMAEFILTPELVSGLSDSMVSHCASIPLQNCIDIVGTGGDGQDTFNVSTASGLIVAGAGCKVAKHGNRASSSSCGSADVLEECGAVLDLTPDQVSKILTLNNFCFLFAQSFHPSMKSLARIRKELGFRTVFNLLGPMCNPARPCKMVVGVAKESMGPLMIQSLRLSGVTRAWVVFGQVGLDEISPQGPTTVWSLQNNVIETFEVSPSDFGMEAFSLDLVRGGTRVQNAQIMTQLLSGELAGPILDYVLMNSAALLLVSGAASTLLEGVQLARQSISSGSAKAQLSLYVSLSNSLSASS